MSDTRSRRFVLDSIEREFTRYESLGLGVIDQLEESDLSARPSENSNSVAQIVWHISGNLRSRFTDFLETDGEKSWRNREDEFAVRTVDRAELLKRWESGWAVLRGATESLRDEDLTRLVQIRGNDLTVLAALLRSLAHLSYHVGQMVYVGKQLRGDDWTYLSIAPGGTDAYNRDPTREWGPGEGSPEPP